MLRVFFVILVLIMAALSAWMVVGHMNRLLPITQSAYSSEVELPQPHEAQFTFHYSEAEKAMLEMGWLDVCHLAPDVEIRLVYASKENFTDSVLYDRVRHAFLEPYTAGKLAKAQQILQSQDSSLRLVLWDAGRPQSVQYAMWDWAVAHGKQKYIAPPTLASNHNYGCAVDVTLARGDSLLDMGTAHDHFGPEAEPRYHWQMLESGKLTRQQVEHRLLLKTIMRQAGFQSIQTEWWHFNGVSKGYAREHFKLLR